MILRFKINLDENRHTSTHSSLIDRKCVVGWRREGKYKMMVKKGRIQEYTHSTTHTHTHTYHVTQNNKDKVGVDIPLVYFIHNNVRHSPEA